MTPPPTLPEFAAVIEASSAPAVVMIDRAFALALLAYVRALEREVESGSFY